MHAPHPVPNAGGDPWNATDRDFAPQAPREAGAQQVRHACDTCNQGIKPYNPWKNGYNESFIGKLGDKLLNMEIFYPLMEAHVLIER